MILLLPPQLDRMVKQQTELCAHLHGIKNPVVTELEPKAGMRRFEIVEGEVTAIPPPPSDTVQPKIT